MMPFVIALLILVSITGTLISYRKQRLPSNFPVDTGVYWKSISLFTGIWILQNG